MSSKSKANKKKAVAIHERATSACNIDEDFYTRLLRHHASLAPSDNEQADHNQSVTETFALREDTVGVLRMIRLLAREKSFDAQVQVVHLCKAGIKSALAEAGAKAILTDTEYAGTGAGIEILLHLYLSPYLLSLRKYLEWVVDALATVQRKCSEQNYMHVIRDACLRVLTLCEWSQTPILTQYSDSSTVAHSNNRIHGSGGGDIDFHGGDGTSLFLWSHSFAAMSLLDKDLSWMSVCTTSLKNDHAALMQFLTTALHAAKTSTQHLLSASTLAPAANFANDNLNTTTNKIVLSETATIAYRESVSECLKAITVVLKARKHLMWMMDATIHEQSAATAIFASDICKMCLHLLREPDMHKDVLTNASMAYACVQWLYCTPLPVASNSNMHEPLDGAMDMKDIAITWRQHQREARASLQLLVLSILLSSETPVGNSADLKQLAQEAGLAPDLVQALLITDSASNHAALPVVGRTSLIRGFLSLYPSAALCWCKQDELANSESCTAVTEKDNYSASERDRNNVENAKVFPFLSLQARRPLDIALNSLGPTQSIFFGPLLTLALNACDSSGEVIMQLYGLQTLEVWLGAIGNADVGRAMESHRLESSASNATSSPSPALAPTGVTSPSLHSVLERGSLWENQATAALIGARIASEVQAMQNIATVLCVAWPHPNKKVSHLVPVLHARLVDSLEGYALAHHFTVEQRRDMWAPLVSAAIDMPAGHRARYQSLGTLLPRVGGPAMLAARQTIFAELIAAIRLRDVCSSACACLGSLLRELIRSAQQDVQRNSAETGSQAINTKQTDHHVYVSIRELWLGPVVNALCSANENMRLNAVNYLLPELMRIDVDCGVPIIIHVRELYASSLSAQCVPADQIANTALALKISRTPYPHAEYCLWALVSVCLQCRVLGLPGGDIFSPSTALGNTKGLTSSELTLACTSADVALRMSALTALTVTSAKAAPIPPADLKALREYLPLTLNCGDQDSKQRLLRVIKSLVQRLLESHRVVTKQTGKKSDSKKSSKKTVITESEPVEAYKQPEHIIQTTMETLEWLADLLLANLYPGATADREVVALEMVFAVLDVAKSVVDLNIVAAIASRTDSKSHELRVQGDNAAAATPKLADTTIPLNLTEEIKSLLTVTKPVSTLQADSSINSKTISYCPFFSVAMTNAVLNLLSSSWDRSRRAAAELLLRFPRPLPGYGDREHKAEKIRVVWLDPPATGSPAATFEQDAFVLADAQVTSLVKVGLNQCGSARQRESEAGALLLNVLFTIYCADLGWGLRASLSASDAHAAPPKTDSINKETDYLRAASVSSLGILLSNKDFSIGKDNKACDVGKVQTHLVDRLHVLQVSADKSCPKAEDYLSQYTYEHRACAALVFLLDLVDTIDRRIEALAIVFATMNVNGITGSSNGTNSANVAEETSSFLLCNGLLLALRYCLSTCQQQGLLLVPRYMAWALQQSRSTHDGGSDVQSRQDQEFDTPYPEQRQSAVCIACWYYLIQRVRFVSHRALDIAMTIVAEAQTDVPFAPQPSIGRSILPSGGDASANRAAFTGTKGPVNSTQDVGQVGTGGVNKMAAVYLNANSVMSGPIGASGGDGEGEAEEEELKGSAVQRAVIAAWMLVRESSATLALLVELSPPAVSAPSNPTAIGNNEATYTDNTGTVHKAPTPRGQRATAIADANSHTTLVSMPLLTSNEIANIGNITVDALGRLKHMGAIAEVHAAFQTMCTHLLRCVSNSGSVTMTVMGQSPTELQRLPLIWLRSVLGRLEGGKQVFVLRRSAGFAYTFLSLLRAEPLNVTPTLLPIALNELLNFAETGMSDDGTQGAGLDWPTAVHAMNALRLIIIDSCLAGDIDTYIERSLKLAVTGFLHCEWGVRNSSMMVFAAIMQRAVDNDKRSEASARGSTARAFFGRFPGLLPFLLAELTKALEGRSGQQAPEIPISGESLSPTKFTALHGGVTPSLYPILLLLAKMKPEECRVEPGGVDEQNSVDELAIECFLPLLYRCASLPEQKVRNAAAAAVAALTPLSHALIAAAEYSEQLRNLLAGCAVGSPKISTNETHGRLLQTLFLLRTLQYQPYSKELHKINHLLSVLWNLLEELSRPYAGRTRPYGSPACVRIFLSIVRTLATPIFTLSEGIDTNTINAEVMVTINEVQDLWVATCRWAIWPVCPTDMAYVPTNLSKTNTLFTLPYEPLLWQESLQDMMLLHARSMKHSMEGVKFLPVPLPTLLSLLDHPLSEIRIGILEGCIMILTKDVNSTTETSHEAYTTEQILSWTTRLLQRLPIEKEPILLTSILRCLALMLLYVKQDEKGVGQSSAAVATTAGRLDKMLVDDSVWLHLYKLCSKPKILPVTIKTNDSDSNTSSLSSPLKILQEVGQLGTAVWNALSPSKALGLFSTNQDASSISIEGEEAKEGLSEANDCELRTDAGVAGSLEILGQIVGRSLQLPYTVWSGRVEKWLCLIEKAAKDYQPTDVRIAAARSLLCSSISCVWATAATFESTQRVSVSSLRVRVWQIALVLLQDDDDTVRDTAGEFVRCASPDAHAGAKETSASSSQNLQQISILPLLPAVNDINVAATSAELGKALLQLALETKELLPASLESANILATTYGIVQGVMSAVDAAVGPRQSIREAMVSCEEEGTYMRGFYCLLLCRSYIFCVPDRLLARAIGSATTTTETRRRVLSIRPVCQRSPNTRSNVSCRD